MTGSRARLYMVCGKIAAGKSTLAGKLGAEDTRVVISEDTWLGGLFRDQMDSPVDYVRLSAKLRDVMGPHVVALLRAGVSVVLDFPANTIEIRAWMRGLFEQAQVGHELHVLMPPDAVCLERLRARNAGGAHPFAVSEAQFHQISKHFVAPGPEEGFAVVRHEA